MSYRPRRNPTAHFFRRATTPALITLSSNANGLGGVSGFVGAGQAYTLNDVVNSAEFNALYDQFRILKVAVHFRWNASSSAGTGFASEYMLNPPNLMSFPDYDDNAAPNAQEFHERATTRMRRLTAGKIVTVYLTPAVLVSGYEAGGISVAYIPKWRQWIDIADITTQHFGLKVGFRYSPNTAYGTVETWYTVSFQCKNQR